MDVVRAVSARSQTSLPGRDRGIAFLAVALAGAAGAVVVGYDGGPGWRAARVLVVAAVTAGVVAAVRHLDDRACGRVLGAAGGAAVALTVGLVPVVLTEPRSVLAAGAVGVLVGGLALLVIGAAMATRGRRPARRWATGAAVLVPLTLVGLAVGPAVAATNVPRPRLGDVPADRGLAAEDVRLLTDDGVPLGAWYLPSADGAAVVLLHGAGSTRSDVLDEAVVLHRHGFGVLMIDARGHGTSGGRAMDFGWHGDADIAAGTAYLASRPEVDPQRIGAVGVSMGGEEALGASGTNRYLRAVVAEGATARVAGDEGWLSEAFGWRGLVQEQLERLQDVVVDALSGAEAPVSMRSAVRASGDTRYLLITAGGVADEARAAAYIAGGAPDRVETWAVADSGHAGGLDTAPEAWEARVVAFLDGALALP